MRAVGCVEADISVRPEGESGLSSIESSLRSAVGSTVWPLEAEPMASTYCAARPQPAAASEGSASGPKHSESAVRNCAW